MDQNITLTFTRNGRGKAPEGLQSALAVKFLAPLHQTGKLLWKIIFYTEGVKLV